MILIGSSFECAMVMMLHREEDQSWDNEVDARTFGSFVGRRVTIPCAGSATVSSQQSLK